MAYPYLDACLTDSLLDARYERRRGRRLCACGTPSSTSRLLPKGTCGKVPGPDERDRRRARAEGRGRLARAARRDVFHNIYLLGLFEEFGIVPRAGRARFAFHGRFDGQELTAALFVGGEGGLVVPSASDARGHHRDRGAAWPRR